MTVPTRRKLLVSPGELIPKTAVWPVRAQTWGFLRLQSRWRKAVGWWACHLHCPTQSGHLPSKVSRQEAPPHLLPPTSRALQSRVAGNSSCCSVMLKAEKYYAKIFTHKGKGLILKEFIMAWNNWSLHTGKVGVLDWGLQSGGMGDDCCHLGADIFCWVIWQSKQAKAVTVLSRHPNNP